MEDKLTRHYLNMCGDFLEEFPLKPAENHQLRWAELLKVGERATGKDLVMIGDVPIQHAIRSKEGIIHLYPSEPLRKLKDPKRVR